MLSPNLNWATCGHSNSYGWKVDCDLAYNIGHEFDINEMAHRQEELYLKLLGFEA